MKWLTLILLATGCVHAAGYPPLHSTGQTDLPYTGIPGYLAHPVAGHELPPRERDERMWDLLRVIDAQAATLGARDATAAVSALSQEIDDLAQLVPPRPEILVAVARMRAIVDDLPRTPPDQIEGARQRLWAMSDLIRLRLTQSPMPSP